MISILIFLWSGFLPIFPFFIRKTKRTRFFLQPSPSCSSGISSARTPVATRDAEDTSRPNTLKIHLRAQSRAGSARAIQLLPTERNVALYDSMPAKPRTLGAVGKGQTNIRPMRSSPLPTRSLIFLEFLEINLDSLY